MVMQRIQLRDARLDSMETSRASNLQTFETTFFNLLGLHNSTVKDLHFAPEAVLLPREERARALDRKESNGITVRHMFDFPVPEADGRLVFAAVLQTMIRKAEKSDVLQDGFVSPADIYELIQVRHNYVLGHYFRNLYQILSFIDSYGHRLSSGHISNEFPARKRYANMLRAQLSANELVVLFFNCAGYLVDQGEFRALLDKYQFLEHMPVKYNSVEKLLTVPQFDLPLGSSMSWYLTAIPKVNRWKSGVFGENHVVRRYLDNENASARTDLLEAWFS
jgi:hypothetical protein